jgi:hypothetical protein
MEGAKGLLRELQQLEDQLDYLVGVASAQLRQGTSASSPGARALGGMVESLIALRAAVSEGQEEIRFSLAAWEMLERYW